MQLTASDNNSNGEGTLDENPKHWNESKVAVLTRSSASKRKYLLLKLIQVR